MPCMRRCVARMLRISADDFFGVRLCANLMRRSAEHDGDVLLAHEIVFS